MDYKPFTGIDAKARGAEYVAHMNKLAPIPIPESAKDLRIGARCTVPLGDMLATNWCDLIVKKGETDCYFPVGVEEKKHDGHTDTTSAHKLDFKDTVSKLPDEWITVAAEIG